jgi:hypothetical protein
VGPRVNRHIPRRRYHAKAIFLLSPLREIRVRISPLRIYECTAEYHRSSSPSTKMLSLLYFGRQATRFDRTQPSPPSPMRMAVHVGTDSVWFHRSLPWIVLTVSNGTSVAHVSVCISSSSRMRNSNSGVWGERVVTFRRAARAQQ